jgi:flagellar L-ring protein precursor FlgH
MQKNEWPAVTFAPVIARRATPREPQSGGMGPFVAGVIGVLLLLLAASSLHGQVHAIKQAIAPKPNVAETSLDSYLERVRAANSNVQPLPGAIWADSGRLTRMNADVRAMRPHDLISVVVEENLAASTDGTVKNSRASNANSGLSGLMGTLHAGNALQNLITQNSASALTAQGASATNSSLSTVFGGQVMAVLPNGILVIEAARQVEFSQQTQTIVLHGLVRPEDISQQNQVLSTAISSLELEVRGKGIINDYTHRQNALVRLLQQILIF